MKKILIILTVLATVMLTSSCQKELPDEIKNVDVSQGGQIPTPTPTPAAELKVSELGQFGAKGGQQTVTITATEAWTLSKSAGSDWLTVKTTSGKAGTSQVDLSASENIDTKSRTATITVKSGKLSKDVEITQSAANSELKLNKNDLSFTATGGSDSFTITSNTNWSVTSNQTWCTVSTSSGSNNATIMVNLSENASTELRSATITVMADGLSQTIAVTQDTRLKLNLRFIESDIVMHSDETVSVPFTHDGNLSKLDDSQFKCIVDEWYPGGVYLAEGYVHVDVGESLATVDIELRFTGNEYYFPESISIMVTYIPPVNDNTRTFTANGVSFNMIRVDGGTFTMGATSEQVSDDYDDEKPAHQVTLSTYYIGETEVTQELWEAVMGQKPTRDGIIRWIIPGLGNNYPAYYVSWYDCQDFIKKLNSITNENFRLPTEAEWEYAARGGNKSRGYKFAGSNTIDNVAWYGGNSGYQTHNVATKSANELGIYDMSGNVCEWCQDWYGSYSSSSQTNPNGPSSGSLRVFRGGGWDYYGGYCDVSSRNRSTPGDSYELLGLRLALQ